MLNDRDEAGSGAAAGRVLHVARCDLSVDGSAWDYAARHAGEIAAYWRRRLAESPGMFDGTVLVLAAHRTTRDALSGDMKRVDFKSFLHWRERGARDGSIRDCFGSAIVRSREGHVMLGRQRAGNINAGLAYLPGGFIDCRDETATGRVDIDGSVARELAEETGLDAGSMTRTPGYFVTLIGAQVSIGIEYRSELPAAELQARVETALAGDPEPELEAIVMVARQADAARIAVPDYTRVLLAALLLP